MVESLARKKYQQKFNASESQRKKRRIYARAKTILAARHLKELREIYRDLASKENLKFKYFRK